MFSVSADHLVVSEKRDFHLALTIFHFKVPCFTAGLQPYVTAERIHTIRNWGYSKKYTGDAKAETFFVMESH